MAHSLAPDVTLEPAAEVHCELLSTLADIDFGEPGSLRSAL